MSKQAGQSATGRGITARIVGAIVFVSALWFGVAGVAAAENLCMPQADIAKRLESGYAETPVAIGLSANGGLVEVFASPDGETWTLVITTPKGISCVVIAGEAWDDRDTAAPGPDV
jgi:TRAP-type mannitol/chloroaromatic compound transport system permease large subunit